MRRELIDLMPDTTLIFLEDDVSETEGFDIFLELKNGRIDGIDRAETEDDQMDDLARKLRIIAQAELFADLAPRNQRLLAFSAQRYEADTGQVIFAQGAAPDAVYLCYEGCAEMSWADETGKRYAVSSVEPGRVVGDLAVIQNSPRQLDLIAKEPSKFLRIGGREYLDVVQTDPHVAFALLRTVSGYMSDLADRLREVRVGFSDETIAERMGLERAREVVPPLSETEPKPDDAPAKPQDATAK